MSKGKRNRRKRREMSLGERARKTLNKRPDPKPGESRDAYLQRAAEWMAELELTTEPELMAEIHSQMKSDNQSKEDEKARSAEHGDLATFEIPLDHLHTGMVARSTQRAADLLLDADWHAPDFVEYHLERCGPSAKVGHDVGGGTVVAQVKPGESAVELWEHGERPGEEGEEVVYAN